jgi:hypothetical protein
MARKTLTIGITINLENYENLRLDVQGEVGEDGNVEGLISFLDGMLLRLGHGDQATAERVEAYRRRVLKLPEPAAAAPVQARREEAPPAGAPAPRPVSGTVSPEPVSMPRGSAPAEAGPEAAPPGEAQPAAARGSPESGGTRPGIRAPERKAGMPPGSAVPQARKGPAPPPEGEAARPAGGSPGKPQIAEGEVACEGCGLAITRNQEKLSRLLTGKSLCKRCMNPR